MTSPSTLRTIKQLLLALVFATTLHAQLPVPRESNPNFFGEAAGQALFFATTDDGFPDLWRTDGTAGGTQLVKDLGKTSELPDLVIGVVNGKPLYHTQSAIYTADATSTTKLASIPTFSSLATNVVSFGGSLYFGLGSALWRSDGTAEGTHPVDFGATGFARRPSALAATASTLFIVTAGEGGRIDLYAGANGAFSHVGMLVAESGTIVGAVAAGNQAFVMTLDGEFADLWASDGTAAGTKRLRRFTSRFVGLLQPVGVLGERFLFSGYEETSGVELWISDGTVEGTHLFADIFPGYGGSVPVLVGSDGTRTYLQASYALGTDGLISIDAAGAIMQLAPLGGDASRGVASNGRFFFPVYTLSAGRELWVTDGTPGGTRRVADLFPGPGSGVSTRLMATSFGVLFGGDDGTTGFEPWITDGTREGTRLLKNIRSEAAPQSDDDGVTDDVENRAPNNGDADGDGKPDRASGTTASRVEDDTFVVTASCELRQVRAIPLPLQRYFTWYAHTRRAVEFQLPCASASVTVLYSSRFFALPRVTARTRLIAHAREVGGDESTARWFVMPGVTFDAGFPSRARFTLTDGGPGDDSPAGDGRIVHRSTIAEVPTTRDRGVRH